MISALVASVCLIVPSGAVVIDPFRAPICDRCAGNRGLELALPAGSPVTAGAEGTVWFAGQVGGRNYVVLRATSDPRIRITYGGIDAIAVQRGERVARGQRLGRSIGHLFLGVRLGDRYIDPLTVAVNGSTSATAPPDVAATPRFRVTLGSAAGRSCASN